MPDFTKWYEFSLEHVLDVEGGYVNHADDPGGPTNRGISLRWLRSTGDLDEDGWLDGDMDHDGDVDVDDIKLITEKNAKELYHAYFWSPVYEQLPDQFIARKVFDMRVNMGKNQAHKLLQRACNYFGPDRDVVADDGSIGPATLSAVGIIGPEILPAIRATQAGFYRALIMRNKWLRKHGVVKGNGKPYEDFSKFKKGWIWRARQ